MVVWNFITRKENLAWYLVIVALFALYYSQERILNTDCSNFLFHILNFREFCFPEFRVGAFFTQLPLFIAASLHWPLTILVPLFSLSFVALYALLFWVCLKPLNNFVAASTILLTLVTGLSASYFHPVTETQQIIVYSALLYAWVSNTRFTNPFVKQPITVAIITWCALTHPISLFTVLFVLGYHLLDQKEFKRISSYLPFLYVIIVFGARILSTSQGYDAMQYDNLKNFKESVPVFFSLPSVQFITGRFGNIYLVPLVLFILNSLLLVINKRFLLLALHTFGVAGFLLISIFTFNKGDTYSMMEKSFLPAVFMVVFVFCALIFRDAKYTKASVILTHLCMIFGLYLVADMGKSYAARIRYFKSIIAYQKTIGQPKMIVRRANLNPQFVFNEWSLSVDMMVLSKMQDDHRPYTCHLVDNLDAADDRYTATDLYLHLPFWPYIKVDGLNRTYFDVPHGSYYILPEHIKL